MTQWNPQQLEAITARNKNILVSASAGAGKTTILVERMMRLICEERYPIDSILAMTFTEAAANEMKKRLSAELMRALNESSDELMNTYLKQQISKVQSSYISTIHSFCLSIIQDYFYVINLDRKRASNIMDDGASMQAKQSARDEMLKRQYEKQDDSFIKLLWYFSTRPEDTSALLECIESIVNTASAHTDPYAWIESFKNSYNISKVNELPFELQSAFFSFLNTEVLLYEEKIEAMLQSTKFDENFEEEKKMQLYHKLDVLEDVKDKLSSLDYTLIRESLINVIRIRISTNTSNDTYTSMKKAFDDQEKYLLSILYKEEDVIHHSQMLVPLIDKLSEMCIVYMDLYAETKREMRCIDFNDMEHFALEILQANDFAVSKEYIARFNEVMVDEFQDTNPVQDAIVSLVSKSNNVFRVGDIKQSIYGFRQASPQIMKSLMDNPTEQDQVIHLGNNYRSKQMIVDFNNTLFDRLMNVDTFSSEYTKHDNVETGVPSQKEDNFPIEFHALFHNSFKEEHNLRDSKNQIKASYIAKEIARLYQTGDYQWKDFCILGRSNAVKSYMKEAFDLWNIPYFIDTKSGFYESSSVQIISSFLQALVDSKDDIAMVAILSSPMFSCSFDDISQMKLNKGSLSFYEYLVENPIVNFDVFLSIKESLSTRSLHVTMQEIFKVSNFYNTYTDPQERTNLDMLFDIAVDFEEEHYGGIHEFLVYMEQMKGAQTGEAIPIGSEEDVVRVMTIHQSKGLQFPVVYLFSNTTLSNMEARQSVICDSNLGLGMKAIYEKHRTSVITPQRLAIDFIRKQEGISEEMRILYVATTRAQREMYIVDCLTNDEDLREDLHLSSFYNRSGYTSWILRHFTHNEEDFFHIKQISEYWEIEELPTLSSTSTIQQQRYKHPTETLDEFSATARKTIGTTPSYGDRNLKGMQYGTNMHTMIEILENKAIDEKTIMEAAKSIHFDIRKSDIDKLIRLYTSELFIQLSSNSTLHYELPFMVELPEGQSFGFMDLVAINEDTITIIDFKTDAKSETELIEAYQDQLQLYQLALKQIYPKINIQTYIYSLYLNSFISL